MAQNSILSVENGKFVGILNVCLVPQNLFFHNYRSENLIFQCCYFDFQTVQELDDGLFSN